MPTKPIKLLTVVEMGGGTAAILMALRYGESVGVLTRHMMLHIILMMLAAPALAGLIRKCAYAPPLAGGIKSLPAAALLQAALFLFWHSPPGLAIAARGGGLMHIMLLFSGLWFWLAVFDQAAKHIARTVFALLLTGKLFCLLAVLLVFAPRILYGSAAIGPNTPIDLGDQQAAGLLMLTACPLIYGLAAIVLVWRWFQGLCDKHGGSRSAGLAPGSAA